MLEGLSDVTRAHEPCGSASQQPLRGAGRRRHGPGAGPLAVAVGSNVSFRHPRHELARRELPVRVSHYPLSHSVPRTQLTSSRLEQADALTWTPQHVVRWIEGLDLHLTG